jgi:protein-S-isoprenylcysteine O-methyltransferase Ste14
MIYSKRMMKKSPITLRVILQMLFFVVVIPFLPLLVSWQWDWWEAWIYALVTILGFIVSRIIAARRNPDLIAERARFMNHEDTAPWDKVYAPLLAIGASVVMIIAGLDMRFNWSPAFSLPLKILALMLLLAGYALGSYALIENRFFSGVVRIQAERGHHVVSAGPYRWVRHPGYAGAVLTYLATPIILDSSWTFLPTVFLIIVLVIRTRLEDRFLQENLDGYRAYASRVRSRLLPGIW